MDPNPINLCSSCAHAPYCVLTHDKRMVSACTEFEPKAANNPKPLMKITNKAPEMASI